jgi:hypothetical protein
MDGATTNTRTIYDGKKMSKRQCPRVDFMVLLSLGFYGSGSLLRQALVRPRDSRSVAAP